MAHATLCRKALAKVIPKIFGSGYSWIHLRELRVSVQLFVDDGTHFTTIDLPRGWESTAPEATTRRAFVRIRPCNLEMVEGENDE